MENESQKFADFMQAKIDAHRYLEIEQETGEEHDVVLQKLAADKARENFIMAKSQRTIEFN